MVQIVGGPYFRLIGPHHRHTFQKSNIVEMLGFVGNIETGILILCNFFLHFGRIEGEVEEVSSPFIQSYVFKFVVLLGMLGGELIYSNYLSGLSLLQDWV